MRIEFKELPTELITSETVRPRYFEKTSKIPKSIASKIGEWYDWSEEGYLYDIATGKPLITNAKKVGKPNSISINGQMVWTAAKTMQGERIRIANVGKIKRMLVDYFIRELEKLPPIQVTCPIRIGFAFITISDAIDADNMELFYKKAFLDSIQHRKWIGPGEKGVNSVGFIPDDSRKYVSGFLHTTFTTGSENKLVVTVETDKNE